VSVDRHGPRPGDTHVEDKELGLAHALREKLIGLGSMDRGLLVTTLVAIAMVVAAGILLATRDAPWPRVPTSAEAPALTVPLPVLIACSIFLVIAWSYLLAGALHAHLVLRVLGMVAWTVANLFSLTLSTATLELVAFALLVLAAWAMAIAMWLVDRLYHERKRSRWHHRIRLRAFTFLFFALVTGSLYAIDAVGWLHTGVLGVSVWFQLTLYQLALIPMLYLAGTDFAEWSEVVAGRIGSAITHVSRRLATWVLAALTAATAGLMLAERIHFLARQGFTLRDAAIAIAEATVPLAIMTAAGWVAIRRRAAVRVPLYALVVAAAVGIGSLMLGSMLQCRLGYCADPESVRYMHERAPVFTINQDRSWTPTTRRVPGDGEAVVFQRTDASRQPVQFVVLTARDGDPLTTTLPSLVGGSVAVSGDGRPRDGWLVRDYTIQIHGTAFDGRAWTRTEGDERWLLTGISPLVASGAYDDTFQRMVSTWTPTAAEEGQGHGGGAGAESEQRSTLPFVFTVAPFLWLAVFVGAVMLLRRGGVAATGGLFLMTAGVFFLSMGVRDMFGVFFGGEALQPGLPPWIFAQGMRNSIGAVAAWTLVGLAFLAATRRLTPDVVPVLRLTLVVLLALVGLRLLHDDVFGAARSSGEGLPLIQAVVLMLALLWDVAMSGENLTNAEGRRVPRHTRVLIYLGYVMLVATAVLFFSSLKGPGAEEAAWFESDQWPQFGIYTMGVPLVLTFFFVNLGVWLRRRAAASTATP
jgi:hypothetical protein